MTHPDLLDVLPALEMSCQESILCLFCLCLPREAAGAMPAGAGVPLPCGVLLFRARSTAMLQRGFLFPLHSRIEKCAFTASCCTAPAWQGAAL